jgi:hypothetical protein
VCGVSGPDAGAARPIALQVVRSPLSHV